MTVRPAVAPCSAGHGTVMHTSASSAVCLALQPLVLNARSHLQEFRMDEAASALQDGLAFRGDLEAGAQECHNYLGMINAWRHRWSTCARMRTRPRARLRLRLRPRTRAPRLTSPALASPNRPAMRQRIQSLHQGGRSRPAR